MDSSFNNIDEHEPPVWYLRAVSLIPLFFYIPSLVVLPSPVALSVLTLILFYFWFILLTSFSLNPHFPKGRLVCEALVFLSG